MHWSVDMLVHRLICRCLSPRQNVWQLLRCMFTSWDKHMQVKQAMEQAQAASELATKHVDHHYRSLLQVNQRYVLGNSPSFFVNKDNVWRHAIFTSLAECASAPVSECHSLVQAHLYKPWPCSWHAPMPAPRHTRRASTVSNAVQSLDAATTPLSTCVSRGFPIHDSCLQTHVHPIVCDA